jgi:hypothetical protein
VESATDVVEHVPRQSASVLGGVGCRRALPRHLSAVKEGAGGREETGAGGRREGGRGQEGKSGGGAPPGGGGGGGPGRPAGKKINRDCPPPLNHHPPLLQDTYSDTHPYLTPFTAPPLLQH